VERESVIVGDWVEGLECRWLGGWVFGLEFRWVGGGSCVCPRFGFFSSGSRRPGDRTTGRPDDRTTSTGAGTESNRDLEASIEAKHYGQWTATKPKTQPSTPAHGMWPTARGTARINWEKTLRSCPGVSKLYGVYALWAAISSQ
jgi:hypothetical protein